MTTQQFFKGLLMVVMGAVVTAFTTTPINYALLVATVVSVALVYTGKNLVSALQSTTPPGTLNVINIISGFLVALGTGIIDSFTMYFVDGVVIWSAVWKISLSIFLTYISTTWLAPPYNTNTLKITK